MKCIFSSSETPIRTGVLYSFAYKDEKKKRYFSVSNLRLFQETVYIKVTLIFGSFALIFLH